MFIPDIVFTGLIFEYKSYFFLSDTFILLKPSPIGVVIGPFIATLFFSMLLYKDSGISFPVCLYIVKPAFSISNSTGTFAASKIYLFHLQVLM